MQNLRSPIEYQGLIETTGRIVSGFKNIIILGLIVEVVLNCINIITAYDFPWQLAEGEFILKHGYAASSVLQAYGEISPHFANEYILYEILIAIINQITGWVGLCLFFGLLTFLIYAPCLLAFYRIRDRLPLHLVFLFFFSQYIINYRLAARPELIADVCYIAVGMMLLQNFGRRWTLRQTIGFGLLFFVWANVHGSFLLGLFMLGLWYGQLVLFDWKSLLQIKDFTWMRPGLAAAIGSVLNPFGIERFLQPFQLHSLLWGQATSTEMWPLTSEPAWPPFVCAILALIILAVRLRKQKVYWIAAMLLLLTWLTFSSNRYGAFVGLTMLPIIWNELRNSYSSQKQSPSLPFAFGQLIFSFFMTLCFGFFILCLFYAKTAAIQIHYRSFYKDTLVATNSSFAWLRTHPAQDYALLSTLDAGSWSQMPGYSGIHPLLDSGTHRYSDRLNQLYYYTLFSPQTLHLAITRLHINAIILGGDNAGWATILNADPDWNLVQLGPDSQLYIHQKKSVTETASALLAKWDPSPQATSADLDSLSFHDIARGFNLRPDEDSLRLLTSSKDILWMFDPQKIYLQDWLNQVLDSLVSKALQDLGNKMDNHSAGLRILFLLKLKQYQDAVNIADQWKPSMFSVGYQNMQELRAEAYLSAGNRDSAKRILETLWPRPRYSLRWARLCQQAYSDAPGDMPETAKKLISLDGNLAWQEDLIASLNQNILRLSSQAP